MEIWIPVREVAELEGISKKAVHKKIKANKYIAQVDKRQRKGKERFIIALSSLSGELKKKYEETQRKEVQEAAHVTEKKRKIAEYRFSVLQEWARYAEEKGAGKSVVISEFLQESGIDANRATLFRWQKAYRDYGMKGLLPGWKSNRPSFEVFSEEALEYGRRLYLHGNRWTLKLAYNEILRAAEIKGWKVGSFETWRRYIRAIPKPVKVAAREGKKVFEDTCVPSIERDVTSVNVMEIIESDHHQVDVACRIRDLDTGEERVCFPWLTVWYDVRSRKVISWVLSEKPNSDTINISLRQAILQYGVPEMVHLDNGKDYRCKHFRGGEEKIQILGKKEAIKVQGLYETLGIETSWAIPYNAKSKTVERFFKTFRTEFACYFSGYRGKNYLERPDGLEKKIRKKKVHSYEYIKEAIHVWVDHYYNEKREHRGKGMEKRTPNQVFFSLMKEKRAVKEEELVLLTSKYMKPLTVERDGIKAFDTRYWNDQVQFKLLGEKVFIRYSEDDLSKIFLFDLKGKYIGVAEQRQIAHWRANPDEYKRQMRLKKVLKDSVRPWLDDAKKLTNEQREALIFSRGIPDFQEPGMIEKVVGTKYAAIVAEEQKRVEQQKKADARAAQVIDALADAETQTEKNSKADDIYERWINHLSEF